MPHHACEMFAHFVYGPDLSYHELLEREESLKALADGVFVEAGGEHINFEPTGDTLHAQCALPAYGEDLFRAICQGLLPQMDGQVEGRLLFVSKSLDQIHLYTLSDGVFQESTLGPLPSGPLGEALLRGENRQPA